MSTREGLNTLLAGLDTDNEGVVSFHLWSHLWWSRRRRDFCRFHAGRLTEEFVRNVDTTYNVVARNYLPPRETRSFFTRQTASVKRQIERLQGAAREVGMKTYILTKLVTFSILKENVFPRAAEHLDYAQRQWKHPEMRTRFQARNRFEQQLILDDVALRDSYGIEKMSFAPDDVVVDIGAHVGIFSYMCYRRGSRNIHAYEAEVKNFERLAQFVGDVAGIFPYHLAVFRSDQNTVDSLPHSGYLGDNTGGGTVLFRGQTVDLELQAIVGEPAGAQSTSVIALDEILKQFARVRLLKLDCEGSEFPILLTSQLLERVEQVLGEYHEIEPAVYAQLDPAAQIENFFAYRVEHLVARLEQCGFQVCVQAHGPHIGFFTATRTRNSE
jgi:FkbM family methyltransferase